MRTRPQAVSRRPQPRRPKMPWVVGTPIRKLSESRHNVRTMTTLYVLGLLIGAVIVCRSGDSDDDVYWAEYYSREND